MAEEGQLNDMDLDALVTNPCDRLSERVSNFLRCMAEVNFPSHAYLAKIIFAAPAATLGHTVSAGPGFLSAR